MPDNTKDNLTVSTQAGRIFRVITLMGTTMVTPCFSIYTIWPNCPISQRMTHNKEHDSESLKDSELCLVSLISDPLCNHWNSFMQEDARDAARATVQHMNDNNVPGRPKTH